MDGLFHGKPDEQMDDLGVPLFLETPIIPKPELFFGNFGGIPGYLFTTIWGNSLGGLVDIFYPTDLPHGHQSTRVEV